MLNEKIVSDFIDILKEELIPAMGCTEPISLAFASARAREVLGVLEHRKTPFQEKRSFYAYYSKFIAIFSVV